MRDISVRFGPVVANDAVNFSVAPGEIHALLGENGAGKTTLMSVLAGMLQPHSGQVMINNRPTVITDPQTARRLGIGMVHQHFMLIDTMSVAENVSLGLPGIQTWFPPIDEIADRVNELGSRHGLAVDAHAVAGQLSVASQQRVEIVKALYRGARILVLDEPTAVLTPQESAALYPVLRSLAAEGTAIVFISHKLHEVMALTDRITVLRRGRVAGSLKTAETKEREIAQMMVGEDVAVPRNAKTATLRKTKILDAEGLTCRDSRGVTRLEDVSVTVSAGEIVGVAGVDGNGQQELAEALVGLLPIEAGRISLDGSDITGSSIAARLAAGIAHIPEDRHRTAIFSAMPVSENVVAERASDAGFAWLGLQRREAISRYTEELVRRFDVRLDRIGQLIGGLSGGNQQKVVLGRALMREPRLVIAVQPTRGLDIGATAFLHTQLLNRRAEGAGVLLVSTELEELMALSDRIVVMFKGRVAGVIEREHYAAETLGLYMAGAA